MYTQQNVRGDEEVSQWKAVVAWAEYPALKKNTKNLAYTDAIN